jgi:uncharacterized protein
MSHAPELRVVQLDEVTPQPWRNGGGVTRELLAWPAGPYWQLRISVADIESDGPFSRFPGVTRWFCVLQGDGVRLAVDGSQQLLRPGDAPREFSGEADTEAWLTGGATRDLNLMLRGCPGALLPALPGTAWQPPAAPWGLFTMGGGRVLSTGPAAAHLAPMTLTPRTLLASFDAPGGAVQFEPDAPDAGAWWWWAGLSQAPAAGAPTRSPP